MTPLFSAILSVVLAVISSGVVVKLLTLRQERRKIGGEATLNEANAASALSGQSLAWVNEARERAAAAERAAAESKAENSRLWQEINHVRWDQHYDKMHIRVLEETLRSAGYEVPRPPERLGPYPPDAPPAFRWLDDDPEAPSGK